MSRVLEGKVALITGSTSGIGLGVATAFAAAGADIAINGFGDVVSIDAMRRNISAEHDVRVIYHGANMANPDDIGQMMDHIEQCLGPIAILVNNAGIQHVAPIEDFPVEKWNAIMAVNLSAAFHTIRRVVPRMKEHGWGRIINVASAHAMVASPFKTAYVAAKHGIAGLTKAVALEVAANGITANAICPGYVMTPLVRAQIPDTAISRGISEEAVVRDVFLAPQPTKRFVEIEELAAFVLFLCSREAASITGAVLPVDGGWTAH